MAGGFQDFASPADPAAHPPRLAALRAAMAGQGLDAFIVPRADAHQGEYVADCDARLRWLTGFSGSAGLAIVTADQAGVFVDGRYRVQVKSEVDLDHFTPVDWPETQPSAWLCAALPAGARVGFDPWLHSGGNVAALRRALASVEITLVPVDNLVDAIWSDRPAPPIGQARQHPDALAGARAAEKCARLAEELQAQEQAAAVLTLPDSISWLLNLRGSDLPRNPVLLSFAILKADGAVQLFADPAKFSETVRAGLPNTVSIAPPGEFAPALADLSGPVRVDPGSAPEAVFAALSAAGVEIARGEDPAVLPKAIKTEAELAGMRAAHLRDGAAMVRLLAWLDDQDPVSLTEIDVVRRLEALRRDQGILDISFDTICGAGPHGAIVHYRVDEASNRRLQAGELLLIDSGGQYPDGTTDITRTLALPPVDARARDPYTRVLRGMIAISRLRFPRGAAGRDIDAVARAPLWSAGLDYDHGTGHGVGAALCVHEGPARISRLSEVTLQPGMILSNEPGYYREGAFGIRIENLIAVTPADSPDGRDMLGFETLTWVPIDRRLIDPALMAPEEIAWLNAYHADVAAKIAPLLTGADDAQARDWLTRACAPL